MTSRGNGKIILGPDFEIKDKQEKHINKRNQGA